MGTAKDHVYKIINELRRVGKQKEGDERVLLIGAANTMEVLIREYLESRPTLCACENPRIASVDFCLVCGKDIRERFGNEGGE